MAVAQPPGRARPAERTPRQARPAERTPGRARSPAKGPEADYPSIRSTGFTTLPSSASRAARSISSNE